jgi:hypothetical protein
MMKMLVQWSAAGLLSLGVGATGAQTVLFNPEIVDTSTVYTGIEARLQLSPRGYDQSVSGTWDLGDVGVTANLTDDPAELVDTVYRFNFRFVAATNRLRWAIAGGPLEEPSVLKSFETDSFNSIRFNVRTKDPAFTMYWSDLKFSGATSTSGVLAKTGSGTNANVFQRIVAAQGQKLSDYDWTLSGKVWANGVFGSQTKMWIASHNVELAPSAGLAAAVPVSAVPEASTAALAAVGVFGLGWFVRRRRSR